MDRIRIRGGRPLAGARREALARGIVLNGLAVLDRTPQAAAAGAGIALPSGDAVTAAFRFPSARSEFAQALNFGPVSQAFRDSLVPLPADHPDGPVDWVAGAAVMMRLIGEADDTGPSAKRRFSSSSSRKRKARSTMVRKTWMSMGFSQKS